MIMPMRERERSGEEKTFTKITKIHPNNRSRALHTDELYEKDGGDAYKMQLSQTQICRLRNVCRACVHARVSTERNTKKYKNIGIDNQRNFTVK